MAEDENTAAANSPVIKAEFNRLLTALEGVQEQIHTMKREFSAEREAADERLAKKIRLDRGMVFKKKTHEKQLCFNEDVREKSPQLQIPLTPRLLRWSVQKRH